jgi:hypothetical protein
VVDEERHSLADLERLDRVVVVEDQHEVVLEGGEIVEQPGQHRADGRRLRCAKHLGLS